MTAANQRYLYEFCNGYNNNNIPGMAVKIEFIIFIKMLNGIFGTDGSIC